MKNFKFLDKFLSQLENIYSIINIDLEVENFTPANLLTNEKFEAKYEPVYLDSIFNKEIQHLESIFKHNSGFFIYLSRESTDFSFKMKVIYRTEQYEEIKLYINSLKKII